ncbi:MAG: PhoD-like phosphatase N-terminal domain-containing protein, partial [Anaerolineae bacterium]|nr:PhoD-like phosphatase N-terminal domain-containing protein [Anaerolineae bacterium]
MVSTKKHEPGFFPVFSGGNLSTVVARLVRVSLVVGVASLLLLVTLSILITEAEGALFDTSIRADTESRTQLTLTRAAGTLPNGVAAGDTTQTSTLLWTRGTTVGNVLFECSTDPTFSTNVLTATAAVTDLLQPVKVEMMGLRPTTTYFYRVTDAASASAEGRLRTTAAVGAHAGLRFGVSGDWNGQLAPYPSIANADERNLNFFVEHGDTVNANSATTLEEFRLKHNEVYSTHLGLNTWADLRGSTTILATIDDNDVRNDFAGGADPSSDSRFDNTGAFINETLLYGNALQAFQEYNPLRDEFYGATGDVRTANKRRLYRFNTYG